MRVTLVRLEPDRNPWLSGDFASKPFLARDAQDGRWVVKPLWSPREAKSLFNEWVCGRLCNLLGVPWPQVALTQVPPALEHPDRPGRPVADAHAVALRWIPDLLDVDAFVERHLEDRPAGYEEQEAWLERGIGRLVAGQSGNLEGIHGIAVAGNWLQAADQQWSVLQAEPSGTLWWMDASCHLGGWGWHHFVPDDPFEMYLDRTFRAGDEFWHNCDLRGRTSMVYGLIEPARLEPWLRRIDDLEEGVWASLVEPMPAHWVEPGYLEAIAGHVWHGRREFTRRYRERLPGLGGGS